MIFHFSHSPARLEGEVLFTSLMGDETKANCRFFKALKLVRAIPAYTHVLLNWLQWPALSRDQVLSRPEQLPSWPPPALPSQLFTLSPEGRDHLNN